MFFFVANLYSGEIDEINKHIDKLQTLMDYEIVEWHRMRNYSSKQFRIVSSHSLFDKGQIESYSQLKWCKQHYIKTPPVIAFDKVFAVPYLNIFVTTCSDVDDYKLYTKDQIQEWLNNIKSKENSLQWMILHILYKSPGTSVKSFFTRSILDRIKQDFGADNAHGRIVQLIIPDKEDRVLPSGAWIPLIQSINQSHRTCLLYHIANMETNLAQINKNMKFVQNWTIFTYMRDAFNLYSVYKQMSFYEEIKEIYISVYRSFSDLIITSPMSKSLEPLKNIDKNTNELLLKLQTDHTEEDLALFIREINPVNREIEKNSILSGDLAPFTFFSLFAQIFNAALTFIVDFESYQDAFSLISEYVLDSVSIYSSYGALFNERLINLWRIESLKWIFEFTYSKNKHLTEKSSCPLKSKLLADFCNLIRILLNCFERALSLHLDINFSSFSNERLLSVNAEDMINNENLEETSRYFSLLSLDKFTSTDLLKDAVIDLIPSSNISPSRSKLSVTASDMSLSEKMNKKSLFAILKLTTADSENNFDSLDKNVTSIKNFIYKRNSNPTPISLPFVYSIVEKIVPLIQSVPSLYTSKIEKTAAKSLIQSTVIISNAAIEIYRHTNNSRTCIHYYITNGQLLSITKNYSSAVKYYSLILLDIELSNWPYIWVRVLLLLLEAICNTNLISIMYKNMDELTSDFFKDENIFDKLEKYSQDKESVQEVLTMLIYLSCWAHHKCFLESVAIIFLQYFENIANSYKNTPIYIGLFPIISIDSIKLPPSCKINVAYYSTIKINFNCTLIAPITFQNVRLIFRSLTNNIDISSNASLQNNLVINSNSNGNLETIHFKSLAESYITFEADNITIKPGDNGIKLVCKNAYIDNFYAYKFECMYNPSCILTVKFERKRPIRLFSSFKPPTISLKSNKNYIIAGFTQPRVFYVNNFESKIDSIKGVNYTIISDRNLTISCDERSKSNDSSNSNTSYNFRPKELSQKNIQNMNEYELSIKDLRQNYKKLIKLQLQFLPSGSNEISIDETDSSYNRDTKIIFECEYENDKVTFPFDLPYIYPLKYSYNIIHRGNLAYLQVIITNLTNSTITVSDIKLNFESDINQLVDEIIDLNKKSECELNVKEELSLLWRLKYPETSTKSHIKTKCYIGCKLSANNTYFQGMALIKGLVLLELL